MVNIVLLFPSAAFRSSHRSKVPGWHCTYINSFYKHLITELLCAFLSRPLVQDLHRHAPRAGVMLQDWISWSNTAQQIPFNREDIGKKSPSREGLCGIICNPLQCYPENCSEISFLKQLRSSRQELTEKLKPTCVTNVFAPKLPCFPIKKIMRTPIVYSFFSLPLRKYCQQYWIETLKLPGVWLKGIEN